MLPVYKKLILYIELGVGLYLSHIQVSVHMQSSSILGQMCK